MVVVGLEVGLEVEVVVVVGDVVGVEVVVVLTDGEDEMKDELEQLVDQFDLADGQPHELIEDRLGEFTSYPCDLEYVIRKVFTAGQAKAQEKIQSLEAENQKLKEANKWFKGSNELLLKSQSVQKWIPVSRAKELLLPLIQEAVKCAKSQRGLELELHVDNIIGNIYPDFGVALYQETETPPAKEDEKCRLD